MKGSCCGTVLATRSLALALRPPWNEAPLHRRTLSSALAICLIACTSSSGPLISAAELTLPEIEERIKNFKTTHGRAISHEEAWETVSQSRTDIPSDEYMALWSLIREQQTPSISLEELLSLVKAKRDSLQTVDVRMRAERVFFTERGDVSPDRSWKQTAHLILSGNKAFCQAERVTRGLKIPSAVYRAAYDGEKMRTVHNPDGALPNTSITAEPSSSMLVPLPNPLSAAMLLDSETTLRAPIGECDLVCYIERCRPTLYEEPVTVGQTDCLLLEDGRLYRVFLDPARDFSVIRFERYHPDFFQGSEIRVTQGRSLERVLEFNSLQDHGNGIFLPHEIIDTYFSNGRKTAVATVTAESLDLNNHFSEEVFSGVVPENALVADYTHGGVVYKQSDSASIGGLLEETVERKRSTTLRTISIVVGLLLIALVLVRQLLMRRKAA